MIRVIPLYRLLATLVELKWLRELGPVKHVAQYEAHSDADR